MKKTGLKLTIENIKFVASRVHHFGQIDRERMETVTDLIFLGSKLTEDGNCSREIKWHVLLGRKAMTNLHSILEEGMDITLLTKVHGVKAMAILVLIYGRESWTTKKAEHQRTVAFELWWWRRLLWVHYAARRSKQSILKEMNPEYSLEGLMLNQKLQYFGHLMPRTNSLEKSLIGKYWGQKEKRSHRDWDGCMASSTHQTEVWENSGRQWRTEKPGMLQSMGS